MVTTLLIAAAIVFVLNAAGSFIEFNNRFVNALVDTVLFAVVFGFLRRSTRSNARTCGDAVNAGLIRTAIFRLVAVAGARFDVDRDLWIAWLARI
jgi:hypothetical protein